MNRGPLPYQGSPAMEHAGESLRPTWLAGSADVRACTGVRGGIVTQLVTPLCSEDTRWATPRAHGRSPSVTRPPGTRHRSVYPQGRRVHRPCRRFSSPWRESVATAPRLRATRLKRDLRHLRDHQDAESRWLQAVRGREHAQTAAAREQADLAREQAEQIQLDRRRRLHGWSGHEIDTFTVALVTSAGGDDRGSRPATVIAAVLSHAQSDSPPSVPVIG